MRRRHIHSAFCILHFFCPLSPVHCSLTRKSARRVEGLAAARSLSGSDDALCRHSLPPRTLRYAAPYKVAVKHKFSQWVILSVVEPAGRHRRWRDLIGGGAAGDHPSNDNRNFNIKKRGKRLVFCFISLNLLCLKRLQPFRRELQPALQKLLLLRDLVLRVLHR